RDEGLRLLAQHVGRVVRRRVPVEVLHVAAGAVRLDDPVVIVGDVLHAVPLAPAGRHVERLAQARVPERVVAVPILPDEARPVAGVLELSVPRIEDYVVLKLLAAAANRRRRARDLADVQGALEAFPERAATSLSIARVRARLRDVYAVQGQRLKTLVALFRQVPRPARG
ncbi:MAG: hypothetical protein E6J83_01315, partial [Deltaproteobacteria bacterium]